jgi:hypothetical protein
MTKKVTTNTEDLHISDYHTLSIQVSLNGLSFCVFDTLAKKVLLTEKTSFTEAVPPKRIKQSLQAHLAKHGIDGRSFNKVTVIHRNPNFSLVPKALFDSKKLAHYLKFNTEIDKDQHIVFDDLEHADMVNVYTPFENINNYLYDLFGDFESQHSSSVMISSLLADTNRDAAASCYVYFGEQHMDLTIVHQKRLLLHNIFEINAPEDATYYLLFALEQLKLDPETTPVKTFGNIEEGDSLYQLIHTYIEKLGVFVVENPAYLTESESDAIDFTVMKTL